MRNDALHGRQSLSGLRANVRYSTLARVSCRTALVKSFGCRRRTKVSEERTRGQQSDAYGDCGNSPCLAWGRCSFLRRTNASTKAFWRDGRVQFERRRPAKSAQKATWIMPNGALEPSGAWSFDGRRNCARAWCVRGPCRVMASLSGLVRPTPVGREATSSVAMSR
jgi:hypothetical protein